MEGRDIIGHMQCCLRPVMFLLVLTLLVTPVSGEEIAVKGVVTVDDSHRAGPRYSLDGDTGAMTLLSREDLTAVLGPHVGEYVEMSIIGSVRSGRNGREVLVESVVSVSRVQPTENVRWVAGIYVAQDGTTIPYRLFMPNETAGNDGPGYPLVLALHGAGGRGTDNTSRGTQAFVALTSPEVARSYPAYVLTPQCPDQESWVDTGARQSTYSLDATPLSNELAAVMELLDTVIRDYQVDPARIYLTGQSMGGYATWDLVMRYPERFAAAIPVCGIGDPDQAERLVDLPIWVFHGARDTTVPVEGSRLMVQAIRDTGGTLVRYTEYPDVEHGSWVPAWQTPELVPWLFGW